MASSARRAGGDVVAWGAVLLGVLVVVLAPPVLAQRRRAAVALRIEPRVGDTLYRRFEQRVEMTGVQHKGSADTTITTASSMIMLSRVLVEGSDDHGTTVTTVIDSVALTASGAGAEAPSESVRRSMEGQRVALRIRPDGSAVMLEAPNGVPPDVSAVVSGMPSTLPDRPVGVGGTWEKTMVIPGGVQALTQRPATLHAVYRLDSLSADGSMAFISMRGTITRDTAAVSLPDGFRMTSSGSIVGSMRVDRRRGWWADSHAAIALKSMLTPVPGSEAPPMRVETHITQDIRTGTKP